MTETVELFVKRRLHLIVDLRSAIHLTPFGGVADAFRHEDAVTVDDGAATADVVGRIGGLMVKLLFPHRLTRHRLACQG